MEVWKDVQGFEGLYQISNKGGVRSLPRVQQDKNGRPVSYCGKVLKPVPNSNGYLRVCLHAPSKTEVLFVHRLVALHFVENHSPGEYTVVNHIDSNYLNNDSTNLEWTTMRGNTQHALKKGRLDRTPEWLSKLRKSSEWQRKPVIGYDPLTGKTFVEFDSIQEAGRNGYYAGSVCNCCNGKLKTHKGLAWKYASEVSA